MKQSKENKQTAEKNHLMSTKTFQTFPFPDCGVKQQGKPPLRGGCTPAAPLNEGILHSVRMTNNFSPFCGACLTRQPGAPTAQLTLDGLRRKASHAAERESGEKTELKGEGNDFFEGVVGVLVQTLVKGSAAQRQRGSRQHHHCANSAYVALTVPSRVISVCICIVVLYFCRLSILTNHSTNSTL